MQAAWHLILLYIGVFALAFYLLARAWRIARRGNMALVSDWTGTRLPHPERLAPTFVALNLIAGGTLLGIGIATPLFGLPFAWWAGLTAIVFWGYFLVQHLIAWKAKQLALQREARDKKEK